MLRALLLSLLVSATAAATPARLRVTGDPNACPTASAVAARLRPLLPDTQIVDDADAPEVRIVDDGNSYRVQYLDTQRVLSDIGHRCEDRADAAAVSIALQLAPPTVAQPSPPLAPKPPAQAGPQRERPIPNRASIDLELDGRIEGSGSSGPGGGGGVRLVVMDRHVGGSLGVAALSPVSFAVASGTTTVGAYAITRVPFDLSFRGGYRWGRMELGGELGFAAMLEVIRGESIAHPLSHTAVDLGIRFAIQARAWLTKRVALFGALTATAVPSPLALAVHDEGPVAKTPFYWLGGAIGLVLRAR